MQWKSVNEICPQRRVVQINFKKRSFIHNPGRNIRVPSKQKKKRGGREREHNSAAFHIPKARCPSSATLLHKIPSTISGRNNPTSGRNKSCYERKRFNTPAACKWRHIGDPPVRQVLFFFAFFFFNSASLQRNGSAGKQIDSKIVPACPSHISDNKYIYYKKANFKFHFVLGRSTALT